MYRICCWLLVALQCVAGGHAEPVQTHQLSRYFMMSNSFLTARCPPPLGEGDRYVQVREKMKEFESHEERYDAFAAYQEWMTLI